MYYTTMTAFWSLQLAGASAVAWYEERSNP